MSKIIKLRRGLDIKLKGKADKIFIKTDRAEKYAVKPTDFHGLVPKLTVKVDDTVKAGSPLFYDKYRPTVKFTAPVSGKIVEINRGERRRILEVVIQADKTDAYESFVKADPKTLSREDILEQLLSSGVWPSIKQRPYDVVANPEDNPKAIFISAFDTSPLAPDMDFIVKGNEADFQTGIDALSKLTDGKIHININNEFPASKVFTEAKGVQINKFLGKHPAGNVGVQIHHIDPINKGEVAWTINPQAVITIGKLFNTGVYDANKIIALTGSEVVKPRYYKLISGACLENIFQDNITEGKHRYISGNVFTGTRVIRQGYLGYYDSQVTVLPEGDVFEFLGWAMPGFNKYSATRSFFSWLMPGREYKLNTNLNGGERAFVMTGQYEKVLPMDVYPMQLFKSILVEDIDLMEKLGIYEVAPEDVALCEFICTSKIEIQSIVRNGLDLMIKELG